MTTQTADVAQTKPKIRIKPIKRKTFTAKMEKYLKSKRRKSKFLLGINPYYDLVEGIDDLLWIKESNRKEKTQQFWESVPSFKEFVELHYDDEIKSAIEDMFGKEFETHEDAFNALMTKEVADDLIQRAVKLMDMIELNAEAGESEAVQELYRGNFTNKTNTAKLRQQKKWYRMHGAKQRLRQRKEALLLRKKKESRDKQNRTLKKGDTKRKNRRSEKHSNEVKLPSDTKVKVDRKKIAHRLNELVPTKRYLVTKGFILNGDNDAAIGELVTCHMGTYTLHKRDGKKIRFTVDHSYIREFIKEENKVTAEDYSIDV